MLVDPIFETPGMADRRFSHETRLLDLALKNPDHPKHAVVAGIFTEVFPISLSKDILLLQRTYMKVFEELLDIITPASNKHEAMELLEQEELPSYMQAADWANQDREGHADVIDGSLELRRDLGYNDDYRQIVQRGFWLFKLERGTAIAKLIDNIVNPPSSISSPTWPEIESCLY